jgi:hypothetical protein
MDCFSPLVHPLRAIVSYVFKTLPTVIAYNKNNTLHTIVKNITTPSVTNKSQGIKKKSELTNIVGCRIFTECGSVPHHSLLNYCLTHIRTLTERFNRQAFDQRRRINNGGDKAEEEKK